MKNKFERDEDIRREIVKAAFSQFDYFNEALGNDFDIKKIMNHLYDWIHTEKIEHLKKIGYEFDISKRAKKK